MNRCLRRRLGLVGLALLLSMEPISLAGPEKDMKLPAGCKPKEGVGEEHYTGSGRPQEVVHEKTGIELVFVPAGEFSMGPELTKGQWERDLPEGMEWYMTERPRHIVKIARAFYLAKCEVTRAQYEAFLGEGAADKETFHEGSGRAPSDSVVQDADASAHPAAGVSWVNAKAYCEWSGLRLPTEAEWEYACRAGLDKPFWDAEEGGPLADRVCVALEEQAWHMGNSQKRSHAVFGKKANAWGLHDMLGNVWEWCEDVWHESYEGAPEDQRPWLVGGENFRVIRGGGWADLPCHCDPYIRRMAQPLDSAKDFGFRPALDVE